MNWLPMIIEQPTDSPIPPGKAKPDIGRKVRVTGHETVLTVTGHTERGFTYEGATPLSIPRMGIQGDGTGEMFLGGLVRWEYADSPVSADPPQLRTLEAENARLREERDELAKIYRHDYGHDWRWPREEYEGL